MAGATFDPFQRRQGGSRRDGHQRPEDFAPYRWRAFKDAVWAPVPWMLEALIVLLFALGDYAGMTTVAVLLGFNVVLGLVWEGWGRPPGDTP
jgi:hypothetical protein